MRIAACLALAISGVLSAWAANAYNHGIAASAVSAPTLVSRSLVGSSPAINGAQLTWNGITAAVDSNQALTSCSITAGNAAGNFLCTANGANAVITITPTGAANLTANNTSAVVSFVLTITGTNANGTSQGVSVPISIYADGSTNAPSGSAQYASLLNGYATRPASKVAGVDYATGFPSGTSFSNPSTISVAGCSYSASPPAVTCTTAGQTISGFDFSLNNGTIFNCQAANLILKNNNFKVGSAVTSATGIINGNASCTNFDISSNTIDGGDGVGVQTFCTYSALIFTTGSSVTLEYNWLKNSGGQNFDVQGGGTIIQRYNFEEQSALCSGVHNNFIQFTGQNGGSNTVFAFPVSIYNTIRQSVLNSGVNAGEGFQFEAQLHATITNAELARNVAIATQQSGANTISYLSSCHQDGAPNVNTGFNEHDNYMDVSGAAGFAYPSNGSNPCPSPTYSNNINMTTGANFTNNP